MRLGREDVGLQLPQHVDVRHPQAPPVRRCHHLAVSRVDGQFVDGHGRQVVVDFDPRFATVERREHAELRAHQQ